MNDAARETEIQNTAFFLWDQAGRPEGRSDEFRRRAEEKLGCDRLSLLLAHYRNRSLRMSSAEIEIKPRRFNWRKEGF